MKKIIALMTIVATILNDFSNITTSYIVLGG